MQNSLIEEIIDITNLDKKNLVATYVKLGEETDELAREILAYVNEPSTLHRYSTKSDIIEECIDTALVAISIAIKAGADSEEINKMFRLKLDKWATILQNEGRLKDITKIPFEIHCTVNANSDIENLLAACNHANVKLISLELINHNGDTYPDVMTSSKFYGTNSEAITEVNRIKDILLNFGITISRSKIETVPWHPLAPQTSSSKMPTGCYFESHIAIILPSGTIISELYDLKALCHLHNAHFSRNIFKENLNNLIQMVTIRTYNDREEFDSKVNTFIQELSKLGFEHERIISEFALYDTNIHHDVSWLSN